MQERADGLAEELGAKARTQAEMEVEIARLKTLVTTKSEAIQASSKSMKQEMLELSNVLRGKSKQVYDLEMEVDRLKHEGRSASVRMWERVLTPWRWKGLGVVVDTGCGLLTIWQRGIVMWRSCPAHQNCPCRPPPPPAECRQQVSFALCRFVYLLCLRHEPKEKAGDGFSRPLLEEIWWKCSSAARLYTGGDWGRCVVWAVALDPLT